jgi:hypothetical protein
MATRRFAGPLDGTTAGPGAGKGGIPCGSPPEPGAGALLERDCIIFLPAQWAPLQLWCCFNGEDDERGAKVIASRPKVHFFQTGSTDITAGAAHRVLKNATWAAGWNGDAATGKSPAGRKAWNRLWICASGFKSPRPNQSFFRCPTISLFYRETRSRCCSNGTRAKPDPATAL